MGQEFGLFRLVGGLLDLELLLGLDGGSESSVGCCVSRRSSFLHALTLRTVMSCVPDQIIPVGSTTAADTIAHIPRCPSIEMKPKMSERWFQRSDERRARQHGRQQREERQKQPEREVGERGSTWCIKAVRKK
jgi:hypothetical protein